MSQPNPPTPKRTRDNAEDDDPVPEKNIHGQKGHEDEGDQPKPGHQPRNIHDQESSPWKTRTKEEAEDPFFAKPTANPMPGTEGPDPDVDPDVDPDDPDPEPKQNPLLGTKDPEWQAWCERNDVDCDDPDWRKKHREKRKGKKGKAPAAPRTPAKEETKSK